MNLESDNYAVRYDQSTATVFFSGTLRLQGREEYREVSALLSQSATVSNEFLTLDMQELEFLNSSGISTLSLFIIEMRKSKKSIRVIGSSAISWQAKSLHNFQRLYSDVVIDIV